MVINRFLNPTNFKRMKDDFKFLFEIIKDEDFRGELDLALRDNYFNLYYIGNNFVRKGIISIL